MDKEELKKEIDEIVFETRFNHIDHHETVGKLLTLFDKHKNPSQKQKPLDEREKNFYANLFQYRFEFGSGMTKEFYDYWTEHNEGGRLMRFEMAKNQPFNIKRRLVTWKRNQKNYGKSQKDSGATPDTIADIYANKFGKQG